MVGWTALCHQGFPRDWASRLIRQYDSYVMLPLLFALAGLAFLDSLDVLLVGVTTAVVYDSRLARRSPLAGGLSFLGGVFAVTGTFGLCTVLGLSFLTELLDFELTPTLRYWGGLAVGIVLLVLACLPQASAPPAKARSLRRRPWVLGIAGVVIGLAQAPTAIPYLAGLAMLAAQAPLPGWWPLIVVVYCAVALLPPLAILLLSLSRRRVARRVYRKIVRLITRYGPVSVRVLFFVFGAVLVIDALIHHQYLW